MLAVAPPLALALPGGISARRLRRARAPAREPSRVVRHVSAGDAPEGTTTRDGADFAASAASRRRAPASIAALAAAILANASPAFRCAPRAGWSDDLVVPGVRSFSFSPRVRDRRLVGGHALATANARSSTSTTSTSKTTTVSDAAVVARSPLIHHQPRAQRLLGSDCLD